MSLTREAILGMDDLPRERIDIPEWNGAVFVRTLTAAERERMEEEITGAGVARSRHEVRASVAAMAVCDESGAALFSAADVAALGRKSAPALCRIFDAAMRLNRIEAADVERLEKNSGASPNGSSATASPSTSA